MTKEKNIDANKLPQDQFAEELLSDDELDKIAGGVGGNSSSKREIYSKVSFKETGK